MVIDIEVRDRDKVLFSANVRVRVRGVAGSKERSVKSANKQLKGICTGIIALIDKWAVEESVRYAQERDKRRREKASGKGTI